jgi:ABC-2 type transport system ATP-binding protein
LVLDEPSDGVDPVGRRQIRDILEALEKKGVTIFLNSHLLVEVELFCRDVAIIHKGKVALQGTVADLTAGSGYRVEAEQVPDNLAAELHGGAKTFSRNDGAVQVLFDNREAANRALDLLRAQQCPIEKFGRVNSTLEDVFIRTVDAI